MPPAKKLPDFRPALFSASRRLKFAAGLYVRVATRATSRFDSSLGSPHATVDPRDIGRVG